jgi:putative hemolysin
MGGIELAVMVGMIAFNSVFAAYEIALASVSPARLKVLSAENRRGASSAAYMKENVEASLSAIQLGITLFGAVAAATGGAGAEESFAPWFQAEFGLSKGTAEFLAVTAIVIPLTAVTIVAGELVPKVFALRNKEWVCLRLSPAMKWFTFSVWPVVWLLETLVSAITDWGERRFRGAAGEAKPEAAELQELRAVASVARTSRLIGPREEGIIHAAARLSARDVHEIMIPAAGISMLDATASLADALTAAHLEMHTRFPVTTRAGDPQAIVGYANFKDIVAVLRLSPADPSLRGITRPMLSFPETDSIAQCLEHLLRGNAHIALVRDAAGAVVGMVTLEDVVEELLGDIGDEYDKLPEHLVPSGPSWVAGAGVTLDRLKEKTGYDLTAELPPGKVETLADWVAGHLGREPRGGDVLVRGGLRVAVRKVRRKRLLEAQVARA